MVTWENLYSVFAGRRGASSVSGGAGGRIRGERGDRYGDAGLGGLDDLFDHLVDHRVERVGVFTGELRGAGEGAGLHREEVRGQDRYVDGLCAEPGRASHSRGLMKVMPLASVDA